MTEKHWSFCLYLEKHLIESVCITFWIFRVKTFLHIFEKSFFRFWRARSDIWDGRSFWWFLALLLAVVPCKQTHWLADKDRDRESDFKMVFLSNRRKHVLSWKLSIASGKKIALASHASKVVFMQGCIDNCTAVFDNSD